jgi:hypothetical protein
MTALPVALEESIDIPWSDEDSLDELVEATLGNDEASTNKFEASTIHTAGTYSESTNDSSLRFGIRFTTEQYHKTKLLNILSDANAAHYLYKEVMNWGSAERLDNYHFNPTRSSRKAQVKYIEKWLQCQYSCPQQIPTPLPGPFPQVVQTITFNFTNQLFTLISDQVLFGNLDNLNVNVDDPFGKYVPPNGLVSTVNSGQWYNTAYRHKVKDPSKYSMMPIIFACDETHLQKGGKAASWPLLFTTSILTQKSRNLPIALRTLGYINDLSLIQSSADDKNLSKELKAERLRAIFKTLLASIIEAQESGALVDISLTFGGVTKNVNLKVPVIFIIGDMQGGDKICCTTCHYSNKLHPLYVISAMLWRRVR